MKWARKILAALLVVVMVLPMTDLATLADEPAGANSVAISGDQPEQGTVPGTDTLPGQGEPSDESGDMSQDEKTDNDSPSEPENQTEDENQTDPPAETQSPEDEKTETIDPEQDKQTDQTEQSEQDKQTDQTEQSEQDKQNGQTGQYEQNKQTEQDKQTGQLTPEEQAELADLAALIENLPDLETFSEQTHSRAEIAVLYERIVTIWDAYEALTPEQAAVFDEEYMELLDSLALWTGALDTLSAKIAATTTGPVTFDMSQGSVTITTNEYSGYGSDGTMITGDTDDVTGGFVIIGNGNVSYTPGEGGVHTVSLGTETAPLNCDVTLTLADVTIGVECQQGTSTGYNDAAIYANVGTDHTVTLVLADNSENTLYGGHGRAAIEKGGGATPNSWGKLVITCESEHNRGAIHECGDACGYLRAFGGSDSGTTTFRSGAAIGTRGGGKGGDSNETTTPTGTNALTNLHIRGGRIDARGLPGWDSNNGGRSGGGAGIGVGIAASSQDIAGTITGLVISGGIIHAEGGDSSAAGIGGSFRAGYVNILINGGTIIANEDLYKDALRYSSSQSQNGVKDIKLALRGPGIGGAGGGTQSAPQSGATVTITGGNVTAYGAAGAAIGGGGGGAESSGADAKVIIEGGTVTAFTAANGAAIGGGAGGAQGAGGNATVTISSGTVETGGDGAGAGIGAGAGGIQGDKGGNAEVTISGGTITTTTIGGGQSQAPDLKGGNATVKISDAPTITCKSIGGGVYNVDASTAGQGGAVGTAKVIMEGGTLTGRVLTEGTGAFFNMTGGTIENHDVTTENIKVQNGGAVYVVGGNVTIDGGTITNCKAKNGGAIYVDGGDVNITSGTINGCTATTDGGAIYVNGGNLNIGLEDCKGTNSSHHHPKIENNTATNSGGALAVHGGKVNIYCGNFLNNHADKGGNLFLDKGTVDIYSGNISTNAVESAGKLNDMRAKALTIVLHYNGTESRENISVVSGTGEYEYTLPGMHSSRGYVSGWSTNFDGPFELMPGTIQYIQLDSDKKMVAYYGEWKSAQPDPSFYITIPETLDLSTLDAKAHVTVTLVYSMNKTLNLSVASKNSLALKLSDAGDAAADNKLDYTATLTVNNANKSLDKLATSQTIGSFSGSSATEGVNEAVTYTIPMTVRLAFDANPSALRYAGSYTDTLTFTASFE